MRSGVLVLVAMALSIFCSCNNEPKNEDELVVDNALPIEAEYLQKQPFYADVYGVNPNLRDINDRNCIARVLRISNEYIYIDTCYYVGWQDDFLDIVGKEKFDSNLLHKIDVKPFWKSLFNEKFKTERELAAFQRNSDRMCQGATGYTIMLNVEGAIDVFQLDFFDNCETPQEKELMDLMKRNFEEW